MRIIGIDPGKTGAIAILDTVTKNLVIHDMPTVPKKNGKVVLEMATLALILKPEPGFDYLAVIEEVGVMPKQGISSAFRFGEGYGALQMAVIGHALPHRFVRPAVWKKYFGLSQDKNLSRQSAMQRFPSNTEDFKLKKHADRAEATLLAVYGQEVILP